MHKISMIKSLNIFEGSEFMKRKLNKYDANYTYKKNTVTIDNAKYPIIEKSNNGLLFPLTIKDNVDMNELKE